MTQLVMVAQDHGWSSYMSSLMDVHSSDQFGDSCYQQNSDLFKPWRPVATIQGRETVRSLSHPFLELPTATARFA